MLKTLIYLSIKFNKDLPPIYQLVMMCEDLHAGPVVQWITHLTMDQKDIVSVL